MDCASPYRETQWRQVAALNGSPRAATLHPSFDFDVTHTSSFASSRSRRKTIGVPPARPEFVDVTAPTTRTAAAQPAPPAKRRSTRRQSTAQQASSRRSTRTRRQSAAAGSDSDDQDHDSDAETEATETVAPQSPVQEALRRGPRSPFDIIRQASPLRHEASCVLVGREDVLTVVWGGG